MKKTLRLAVLSVLALGMMACGPVASDSTSNQTTASTTDTGATNTGATTGDTGNTADSGSQGEGTTVTTPETTHEILLVIAEEGTHYVDDVITLTVSVDNTPLTKAELATATFSCSDATAMTFNGNKATLLKDGTFTITVKYTIDGKEISADVSIDVELAIVYSTIAQVRGLAENEKYKEVFTQGVITATSGKTAFLADETGGIYIYNWYFTATDTAGGTGFEFTVGTTVKMHAYVTAYYDAPQLVGSYKDATTNQYHDLEGKFALLSDEEMEMPTPTEITSEDQLKAMTAADTGKTYTIEGEYVSDNLAADKRGFVNFKLGETEFSLKTDGAKDKMYDKHIDDLLTSFNALNLKEGNKVKITAPYLETNQGHFNFAYFSAGVTLEKLPVHVSSIEVTSDADTVTVGSTMQFSAKVLPEDTVDSKEVNWNVIIPDKDGGAATIDENGLLTASSVGTVEVRAISVANPQIKGTKTIDIVAESVNIDSLDITTESFYLKVERTKQLEFSFLPGDRTEAYAFKTSDKTVATVDENGLVTAVGSGTATITLYAVDHDTVKDEITVTVGDYDHIGDITSVGEYDVDGRVAAVTTKGMLVDDGTGAIYVYLNAAPEYNVGDSVSVSGNVSIYNKAYQFSVNDKTKAATLTASENEYAEREAVKLTTDKANVIKELDTLTTAGNTLYTWTAVAGKDGTYTTLNIPGADFNIEPSYMPESFKFNEGWTYTVTAYIGTIGKYVGVYLVSQTEGTQPALTGVKFDKETATVNVGSTLKLEILPNPVGAALPENVEWKWESEDESVATVADGTVTGKAEGTTTIRAYAVGTTDLGASCTVTVTKPGEVNSIEFTFGAETNEKKVATYSSSFYVSSGTNKLYLENWNNNNNEWEYVRAGSKKGASTATLTTEKQEKALKNITLTLDAVNQSDKIKSTYMYVSADDTFDESDTKIDFTLAKGDVTIAVPETNQAANQYYKIVLELDKGSSNGFIQLSKVVYNF